ncbi:MAG: hypothetical protein LUG27_10065 [Clostridiales bacterium]|nr:hypothetical protein [Clostridiales bacterium]
MKLTRAEKIWLAAVIIFYACYNLPFVPAYGHAKATLIHGLMTLIPLWISVYIGLVKICRIYRLRDSQTQKSSSGAEMPMPETDPKTSLPTQTTDREITKEDMSC